MKKYFISVFITYLLLHLSGCYGMQKITKDEFSAEIDYPDLYVKTLDREYSFEEGKYVFVNDTIYGKGEIKILEDAFKPFEGKITVNEVEKIQMYKSNNNPDTTELLVKTKDKEFIFKSEISNYSVRDDTIYGVGKYRQRFIDEQFESDVAININDTEEIQLNKFNLLNTILISYAAVTVIVMIITFSTSYISIF